jgi:hypothetical protein
MFPHKLWDAAQDEQVDGVRWTRDGKAVLLLPSAAEHFAVKNLGSIVRNLHLWGFAKQHSGGYAHPGFRRNNKSAALAIVRRKMKPRDRTAERRRGKKRKASATKGAPASKRARTSTDLARAAAWRAQAVERRLAARDADEHALSDIIARQSRNVDHVLDLVLQERRARQQMQLTTQQLETRVAALEQVLLDVLATLRNNAPSGPVESESGEVSVRVV